ncbi:copper resistance protein CopC [Micromonospora sp. NPDC051543]|uniref:copper resistance protein CopC n=1 Tax=Micromonospora sp. NPDC051543 TaxID=3364287 RepID=UPI00378984A5
MVALAGRLAAAVLLACVLATTAAPGAVVAAAPDPLSGSDPPAQSALSAPPRAVRLTFVDRVDAGLSHAVVLAADGTDVGSGAVTVDGHTLRLPVDITGNGDFTIAYHVEFDLGGESTGTVRFSVGTGLAPAPAPPAVQRAVAQAVTSHGHSVDPVSATLLVIDGLAVAVVLALLYLRRPYDTP